MLFEGCEDLFCLFELIVAFSVVVLLHLAVEIGPFFSDFKEGAFNLVLLFGHLTDLANGVTLTEEVELEVLSDHEKLVLILEHLPEGLLHFVPVTRTHEWLLEHFDEWQSGAESFN